MFFLIYIGEVHIYICTINAVQILSVSVVKVYQNRDTKFMVFDVILVQYSISLFTTVALENNRKLLSIYQNSL